MQFLKFNLRKNEYYQPKLYAYLLDTTPEIPLSERRPAIIVCPGGGYEFKSDREAEPVAMQYLARNMNAFILQYSVSPNRFPTAVLELAEAVKLVREHADEWFIDPERIIVLGFSAGGHLACSLGTLWNRPLFQEAFGETDAKKWRPDGMILCYPVITMGEYTHEGSRIALLGADATEEQIEALSLEKQVSPDTVPAFLWHTQEDQAVPVENSLQFAMALRKNGVPFELHIYERGGHGLSLCNEITRSVEGHVIPDNESWMELSGRWAKRLGK